MSKEKKRFVFDVTITLRAPFLFRGLEGGAHGFDETQLKDPGGRPVMPADQLRGVIREALETVAGAAGDSYRGAIAELRAAFGDRSHRDTKDGETNDAVPEGDKPNRRLLHFTDLVAEDLDAGRTRTAFRVAIDEVTGAAATGALQVIEQATPPGQTVVFKGTITLVSDAAKVDDHRKLLQACLRVTPSIGAMKSVGFGEIVHEASSIGPGTAEPAGPEATGELPDRLVYDLVFDRPFLVDSRRLADNVFAGADIVPGTVSKGALATKLQHAGLDPEDGEIGSVLAKMRFSHAFPLPRKEDGTTDADAPTVIGRVPASLIAVPGEDKNNGTKAPPLIQDSLYVPLGPDGSSAPLIGGKAPLFPPDWKGDMFAEAFKRLPYAGLSDDIGTSTRTRTSIRDGVAGDGSLFTAIARAHLHDDGTPVRHRLEVDLSALETDAERECARRILAVLESGPGQTGRLDGIGKTDASATLERLAAPPAPHRPRPFGGEAGSYAVLLRTPALMLDLNGLQDESGNWKETPFDAYARYWSSVLPGASLRTFFASQSLAGGYLGHRRRLYGASGYYPFLLTDPGSVFLLENVDEAGLAALCRRGLPLPAFEDVAPEHVSWRTCPFVPENGYGEILADYLGDPELAGEMRKEVSHV
jgi:CRISPR/Cas system CSM-associated protein Csm3 (group 7 of RAMP superfamily)